MNMPYFKGIPRYCNTVAMIYDDNCNGVAMIIIAKKT
jgi:hypothetical protein